MAPRVAPAGYGRHARPLSRGRPPMIEASWRNRATAPFMPEKTPASASGGMVVTNHPLASAAGAEMLASGGNAIDAAIAALFTLTGVEPMIVGLFGGGMAHIRLGDGTDRKSGG